MENQMTPPGPNIDALMPVEMARKAERLGVSKAEMNLIKMTALAVLAGSFIALGAMFSTTVAAGSGQLPFGLTRLLAGLVFCLGLVLVVVAGAELFTGNALKIMAWAGRRLSTMKLIRSWLVVYVGNFAGSIVTALLVFLSGQYGLGNGLVGLHALTIANHKCALRFDQALVLGVLCNALVCLAVWLTYSARSVTDKILAIIFPVTAFVATGLEHSVANMYFIGVGLYIKAWAPNGFWQLIGKTADDFGSLTWSNFLLANLLPVTIGNMIGGVVLVGLVYWFVYLRNAKG